MRLSCISGANPTCSKIRYLMPNQVAKPSCTRNLQLKLSGKTGCRKPLSRASATHVRLLGSGLVARVLEFEVLDRAEPARWAPRRRFTLDKKLLFLSEFPRSAFFMTIATIDIDGGRHYTP